MFASDRGEGRRGVHSKEIGVLQGQEGERKDHKKHQTHTENSTAGLKLHIGYKNNPHFFVDMYKKSRKTEL